MKQILINSRQYENYLETMTSFEKQLEEYSESVLAYTDPLYFGLIIPKTQKKLEEMRENLPYIKIRIDSQELLAI
ncbi:MAG: hypothetical protein N2749_05895 [Clostridia bacterium]|nr:hypothetical protein [Clostridia bacterium]